MGTFIRSNFISTDTSAPTIEALYAADTFTRVNDTALGFTEVGNYEWKRSAPASTRIVNNQAEVKNVSGSLVTTDRIDDGRSNGVLSVTLASLTGTGLGGLVFRGTVGTASEYAFYATPTSYEFKPKTGADTYGTAFTLTTPPTPKVGDVLSVVLNGTSIAVRINGTTLASVTDATYTGTAKGLFVRSATVLFDNFKWEPLP